MTRFTLTVATVSDGDERGMAYEVTSPLPGFPLRVPAPFGPSLSEAFACGSMIAIALRHVLDHLAPGDHLTIATPIAIEDLAKGQDCGMSALASEDAQRRIETIRQRGVEVEIRRTDENDLGFHRTQRLAREGLGDPRAALLKMEDAAPST